MVAEYGGLPSTDEGGVKYIQQDIQGSTRAITSVSGAVKARMDYAAFGEEISSSVGQRTAQGYSSSDSLRQKYAQTERDEASGLDHTWFRKHENRAGRWTSPDPYNGSMNVGNPQSFNRYSYVENQPTNFVDPSGLQLTYRDYYAGLVCALGSDGRNHCIENIYRVWYDDGTGSSDTGGVDYVGGYGGGGDGGRSPEKIMISQIADTLNNNKNACTQALQKAGLLNQLKNKIATANIVSVRDNPNVIASTYFSDANKNEKLSDYFDRQFKASGYSDKEAYSRSSTGAIVTMYGGTSFMPGLGGTSRDGFALHEFTHHATGLSDLNLANALIKGGANITLPANPTENDASKALSDYFNGGCK